MEGSHQQNCRDLKRREQRGFPVAGVRLLR
jgi:hypothetical protein